eukprot:6192056-Pleurochrysis_carterae.AAC.2
MFYAPTVLCGTVFWHCVFRQRLFQSSGKLQRYISVALRKADMWDHVFIPRVRLALQPFMAPAAGIMPLTRGSAAALHFAIGIEPGSCTSQL